MKRSAPFAARAAGSCAFLIAVCAACGGPGNSTASRPDMEPLAGGTSGAGGSTGIGSDGKASGGSIGGSTGSQQTGTAPSGGSTTISASSIATSVGGSSNKGGTANQGGSTALGGTEAKGGSTGRGGNANASGGNSSSTQSVDVGGTGGMASSTGGTAATPASSDPLIGDVKFSTPSQTFRSQIDVAMSTSVSGAEIRFTTDGTLPTASSTLYPAKAVTITATTQVRAQAFVGEKATGAVSTGIYIARTIDPTSDIPIMLVESYGKAKPCDKNTYIDAAVMIWEPVNGVAKMADLPTLVARAGYHVRGQSSMSFAQTPYKIELRDNANKDFDYPVLGMPADSDWALIAPYYDRTLIRNPFVYTLGKEMGMEAPRTANAEVYVNQTTHALASTEYEGIYWVSELIKNNKVRTNLKQLKEADTDTAKISGGYIFKFDEAAAEEPKLLCTGSDPVQSVFNFPAGGGTTTKETPASTTKCTLTFGGAGFPTGTTKAGTCWKDLEVVDPDPLNTQQQAWLTDYIQKFHDSLHKSPIGDYATYIDLPSFIDYLLISELTRNVDAYVRSAYFFKDRDGKLKAGPLWDYNFALGGVGAQSATPASTSDPGWQYTGTGRNVNNWYPKLSIDANFMTQVKSRYTELRKNLWSDASLKKRMDSLSTPLKQAVVRDYARWPVTGVILSSTGFTGGPTTPTWEGQLKVMSDFITARLTWMDANLK